MEDEKYFETNLPSDEISKLSKEIKKLKIIVFTLVILFVGSYFLLSARISSISEGTGDRSSQNWLWGNLFKKVNEEKLVHVGDTKEQVRAILGNPKGINGDIWIYEGKIGPNTWPEKFLGFDKDGKVVSGIGITIVPTPRASPRP